ncbi:MAG: preprotein translocase subunit YajC [Tissierellales bacterium]|nr:preprotein translocase subunit YajC [Tissierellales bacterium]MBN2827896.1 preprotein translocase subunit YajC [Tissierellales bacterium]
MEGGTSLIFMVAMFAIFYFMLIRPQRKRDKQIKDMRAALKRGDDIITIGGIHGKITKVTDDVVVIELEHAKQRMKLQKWAIHSVVNAAEIEEITEVVAEEVAAPSEEEQNND